MKHIKVLGSGCTNCKTTLTLIDDAAKAAGVEIKLEKVEDMPEIMRYGVMSTPGVVIDEKVVHAGGIPSKDSINEWLKDDSDNCCSGGSDQTSNNGGCCG